MKTIEQIAMVSVPIAEFEKAYKMQETVNYHLDNLYCVKNMLEVEIANKSNLLKQVFMWKLFNLIMFISALVIYFSK